MKRLVVLLGTVLIVAACASPQPLSSLRFIKNGASEMETRKAAYECERDALAINPHPAAFAYPEGLIGILAVREQKQKQRDFFLRCMESKGFHLVP